MTESVDHRDKGSLITSLSILAPVIVSVASALIKVDVRLGNAIIVIIGLAAFWSASRGDHPKLWKIQYFALVVAVAYTIYMAVSAGNYNVSSSPNDFRIAVQVYHDVNSNQVHDGTNEGPIGDILVSIENSYGEKRVSTDGEGKAEVKFPRVGDSPGEVTVAVCGVSQTHHIHQNLSDDYMYIINVGVQRKCK